MEFMFLSLLFSVAIAFAFKLFSRFAANSYVAIATNYIICVILGILMLDEAPSLSFFSNQSWIGLSIICGISLFVVFHLFSFSTIRTGIAITALASKMSVIIPAMAGILFFDEAVNFFKILGIALTIIAFYLIFKTKEKILFAAYLLLPFLVFAGNGINDIILKSAQFFHIKHTNDYILFLGFSFLISAILGLCSLSYHIFILSFTSLYRSILAGIILGALNWYSTFYYFRGLGTMPLSIFVPIFNILYVVLTVAMGVLLFREKFEIINFIGILLAILAIFMLLQ